MSRSRVWIIVCALCVVIGFGCGSNEDEDTDSKDQEQAPANIGRPAERTSPDTDVGGMSDPLGIDPGVADTLSDPTAPGGDLGSGGLAEPVAPGLGPNSTLPEGTGTDPATPEGTSPDNLDATSPNTTSPDTASPNTASPDTASPDTASPDTSGPDTTEGNGAASTDRSDLEQQVADFQVPPAWLDSVTSKWDMKKPWGEARQEIRRLLGKNTEVARREGIKLTWDYLQKDDIGNGHEYGMYMFLGNEPIWAVIAYREFVNREEMEYPPYFGLTALASIYSDHGLFAEAEREAMRGLKMRPPKPAWNEMRQAEMYDVLGDVYVSWSKVDPSKTSKAKSSYQKAIQIYPTAKPPYGQHLLPRRAKKVQAKLDLLSITSLGDTLLKDGTYRDQALGYSGDIKLTVKIADGRIADIDVAHQEKIDQNACKLIPERIVDEQSLQIDGISGATVTTDAILAGTLRTLKKAGLE